MSLRRGLRSLSLKLALVSWLYIVELEEGVTNLYSKYWASLRVIFVSTLFFELPFTRGSVVRVLSLQRPGVLRDGKKKREKEESQQEKYYGKWKKAKKTGHRVAVDKSKNNVKL